MEIAKIAIAGELLRNDIDNIQDEILDLESYMNTIDHLPATKESASAMHRLFELKRLSRRAEMRYMRTQLCIRKYEKRGHKEDE